MSFTECELKQVLINDVAKEKSFDHVQQEFGLTKPTHMSHRREFLAHLGTKNIKVAQQLHRQKKDGLSMPQIEAAAERTKKRKLGVKTSLLPDEETLLVVTAEMKALASQPVNRKRLSNMVNKVLSQVNSKWCKTLPMHKSQSQTTRRMIECVNQNKPEAINQKA